MGKFEISVPTFKQLPRFDSRGTAIDWDTTFSFSTTMSRGRNCFVPGCTSGNPNKNKANKERGERNPSLFKAPNDPSLLQQWQKAIPRSDKTLSSKDAVCELHFLDEDILTHYEIKLTDGTISRIERGRPLLKEGSIPRIFPNLPSYFSSNKRKRKPPCVRSEATEKVSNSKKVKGLPINHVENQTSEPNFENENEILRDITNVPVDVTDSRVTMFTNLKNSLHMSDCKFIIKII
ncbi:uncharacterized protein LOC115884317 isoform X1 [Sitophilus oryzae]|uniref:Uncharacterized protein LOC115881213 isoform X1 n=1 Tax=Sitophilus oryzae TaxID=7048 RepID=A0A6J2XUM9_SITOR|nr:uncharacterized protein LOC115881213 isoform X1 [Sitophilus oryzae]XP_030758721.1 uncharacterized protein LOC115884317 isoform X1 [Sitophilus oryzae]